jgi:filamentous hemagglutinin
VLSNSNNLSLAGANNSGHAEGTSQAAVSEGNITIRDQASQQQDIAELSRDTEHANGSIGPIFDKEKEQNRLKEVQLIGEIGGQAMDIIRTQGDINGLEEALKRHPELKDNAEALRNTDTYQVEMQKYGTGSDLQKAAQAVTAALQGLAGGNISQALAGGMNPYVAEQIKKYTGGNDSANVLAHAVWGAIAAEMSGNSAAAGAAGAAGGELAAHYLAEKLYGADTADKIAKLSEEQKQNISSLSTLAAGLAGGVSGDSTANALAGAQAGKNAAENNALSANDFGKGMADIGMSQTSLGASMVKDGASPDEIAAALVKNAQGDMPEGQDAVKGLLIAWGEFFGVPVSALTADGEMTPQRAAEIVASGVPTSEAKLVQYVAAKAVLAVTKSSGKGTVNGFDIKQLPDANGKNHITAVKGDAKIPVDKIELYMRGKASGDLEVLQKEYNALKDSKIANQSLFAKDPSNAVRLKQLSDQMHNIERSRDMDRVLNNAGIPNTPANNSMIMDKLLDSATGVTPANRQTSVVVSGDSGSVRVYATWTILPDGSKRLSTVQTGAFK